MLNLKTMYQIEEEKRGSIEGIEVPSGCLCVLASVHFGV